MKEPYTVGAGGAFARSLSDPSPPSWIPLRCARADAATGLIDVARLGQMLARIKGKIRHSALQHLSPFSVPILLEIGKERSPGHTGETMILREAEEDLIAEALQ